MLDFGVLPPQINSGRMYAGAGSPPMLAAASAYNSTITELTSSPWVGPPSAFLGRMSAPASWTHATGALTHPAAVATHTMTPVGQEGQGNLVGGVPLAGSHTRGAAIGPKYGCAPT